MSDDWTGSQQQRRQEEPGINSAPSATKMLYVVSAGTPALAKRAGAPTFSPIVTKTRWEFDRPYRQSRKSLTFFSNGYLLCVARSRVQEEVLDASNRFHTTRKLDCGDSP